MYSLRKFDLVGRRNPNLWAAIRAFSSSDLSSLKKSVASLLDSLSLKPGGTLVQNCGDSDIGKIVIELAKERKLQTISIIEDKPGNPDTIEELKALGGDIVVPESYTKTWYMKRLVNELSPVAGINFSDGYQATAVGKAVADGGTLVTYGRSLPKHIVYDGEARKPIEWDVFAKGKKLKNGLPSDLPVRKIAVQAVGSTVSAAGNSGGYLNRWSVKLVMFVAPSPVFLFVRACGLGTAAIGELNSLNRDSQVVGSFVVGEYMRSILYEIMWNRHPTLGVLQKVGLLKG